MASKKVTTENLAQMIQKGFNEVDKRFGSVDKRFGSVDKRFDRIEKKLETLEHNQEDMMLQFSRAAYRFELKELEKRVVRLERNMTA